MEVEKGDEIESYVVFPLPLYMNPAVSMSSSMFPCSFLPFGSSLVGPLGVAVILVPH